MTPEQRETPTPQRDRARHVLAVNIAIGVACRVTQYLWRRSYWHDESYLVLDIVGAHFRDAFGPLKLLQASPPAFLIVQIAVSRLFGPSEYSLRIVPLVLACASVAMMALLCRRLASRFVACLATLLFATSDQLIWHASECKQYSGDVFVALLLTLMATGRDGARRFVSIALLSSAAVWFSHPTMFVFGAISLVVLIDSPFVRTRRGTMLYLAGNAFFAASVVVLYFVSIKPQQYPEMYSYWQHDFVPWSTPPMIPFWLARKAFGIANYGCNNAGPIVLATAIVGATALWRTGARRTLLLLAFPLGLNLLASSLHRFPFSGSRVTLYTTPALFLIAAIGVEQILRWSRTTRWHRAAWTLPVGLAAISVVPAAYALVVPRHRGHVRPSAEFIAANRQGDEPIYILGIAEPWRCYLTDPSVRWRSIDAIHPQPIADGRFWAAFASTSPGDAKRQEAIVEIAAKAASITARVNVVGSTAIRFERVATTRVGQASGAPARAAE